MTSQLNQWLPLLEEAPACIRCQDTSIETNEAVQEVPSNVGEAMVVVPPCRRIPSRGRRRNRRGRRHTRRPSPTPTPRAISPLERIEVPGEDAFDITGMMDDLPDYSDIEFSGWNTHQGPDFSDSGVHRLYEDFIDEVVGREAPLSLLAGRGPLEFIRRVVAYSSSPEQNAAGAGIFMLQQYLEDTRNDYWLPGMRRYGYPEPGLSLADGSPRANSYDSSMSPTISVESGD